MTVERRQLQDDKAVESQMLDWALGRCDGHIFVSLPNAPATLETQPKGERVGHDVGGRCVGRGPVTLVLRDAWPIAAEPKYSENNKFRLRTSV